MSPTINLFFDNHDFLYFCKNIKYYTECELIDKTKDSYPIGMLKGNNKYPDIYLHFVHYDSFIHAKDKWIERCKRINYDNMFFIYEFFEFKEDNIQDLIEFDNLDINKMCIVHSDVKEIKSITIISH